MAFTGLLILFTGLAPSFYLRSPSAPPLRPLVIAHGLAFSTWVVLFAVQTSLVAAGRTAVHRRLGLAGALLSLLMVVSAPPLALASAAKAIRRAPADGPLLFLLVILVDIFTFALAVGFGIACRRRSEAHKRWMLLALATLMPPAISRWPIAVRYPQVIVLVMVLFVLAAPIHDRLARRRFHPVSVWGGLALLILIPLRFVIGQTDAWHRVATRLIGWWVPTGS
jgi:hypothetical protein